MPILRLLGIAAVLLLAACEGKEPLYQEQGYVFGTLVEVSVYGETEPRARQAVSEVMQEFQRLHDMLHAWQPSELSEMNAAFARGESDAISAELVYILQDAAQLSRQSQGLFNPAIGGLVQLWGFHADEFKPVQPDEKRIAQLVAANPQMSDIAIVRGRAESKNKFVQVDLGGYAKGYALDRAAELLRKQGIRNALINIGGNVLALGRHGESVSSIRASPVHWRLWICATARPSALRAITSATSWWAMCATVI
jgi:thiamine biosynthesis lipoprotein